MSDLGQQKQTADYRLAPFMSASHGSDADDPVISGYTILAIVSFVIGGLVEKYFFNNPPPVGLLFALFCLFLLFDALNGIKNRIKRIDGKCEAILKKLNGR